MLSSTLSALAARPKEGRTRSRHALQCETGLLWASIDESPVAQRHRGADLSQIPSLATQYHGPYAHTAPSTSISAMKSLYFWSSPPWP